MPAIMSSLTANPDMPADWQNSFLGAIRAAKALVFLYLANGIRLQGTIVGFDKHTIFLQPLNPASRNPTMSRQMIYKHTISTIALATERGQP